MKLSELKELSAKQIMGIIGFWNNACNEYTTKRFSSFEKFVGAIQKGYPYHENRPMILKIDNLTICIDHAFFNMYEDEEELLTNILKEKI